jgi:GAF domain-containing protein
VIGGSEGILVDSDALDATLARLRTDSGAGEGVEVALQRVIEAANAVFDVTGTGLMFVDDQHDLRYVAASDEPGRVLEVAQEEHGVGPCVDSLLNDTVVRCEDVHRIAEYEPVATLVKPHRVVAVLGMPVRLSGTAVGSLNAYRDSSYAWTDEDVAALDAFTSVIETVVVGAVLSARQSTLVKQLEYALENRVTVERAIGAVMGRDRTDAVSAFNALRSQARRERRKLADVARETLDGIVRR